ncbi:DEAD/DEAH box helicase [Bradyrhizobium sp. DASA03005]|uniref:DEAD/DEAH box helicase n=1 Tax=Bradyrhizobium sp. SPXBL-02 TaxID=3395912 RepID=UPI003F6E6EE2
MTEQELHNWLLDNAIADELTVLTSASVLSELDNVDDEDSLDAKIAEIDWQRLLLAGSILAKSKRRPPTEAALRIATSALTLQDAPKVKDAGSVLLQKLSNYRSVELAQKRGLLNEAVESRLGISMRVESVTRALENSVLVQHSGEWLTVNPFQQEFWNEANSHIWISASAPTASGKTYMVLQWLLDQITTSDTRVAVYLAPTRALVSEIEDSLLSRIAGENLSGIAVTSLPLIEKYSDARLGKDRIIFVLTQERLHLLANALNENLSVDLLVADEAHKVGDKLRGVVLQDALERVLRINPKAKFVFVSPATQNPEALLDDAPATSDTSSVDSDAPTVLQNVILASQRPLRPDRWRLALRYSNGVEADLGTLRLSARPTTIKKRLALIAAAAGAKGGTLVYTNGAAEAEEVASLIAQAASSPEADIDDELVALADLAKRGVHDAYLLAPLVKKGVAFHYGNMPSLLREEIERLFRQGKIKFLVCTSTLIEGVNLSCRTIVVRGPRKGKKQPMEPHDFWNLAGRAGRWGNEFQGNIICVDPENTTAWPNGVPQRQRYPIRRETDTVLSDSTSLVSFLEARWDIETNALSRFSQQEQVASYLLTHFLREGTLNSATFVKRHSPELVQRLNDASATLAGKIEIPASVAVRHASVNAVGMQKLLSAFRAMDSNPEDLLPAPPESTDAYERMTKIMGLINSYLYPAFLPATLIPLHTIVVLEWLKGYSLSAIIRARIAYYEKHGIPYQNPKVIRDTMEMVERIARFTAPKYLAAYMDVLKHYLAEIGKLDLLQTNQLDVGVALEFGVSTRTLLSLMELGLSRMSAVAISEKIVLDSLGREEVRSWIEEHNAELDGLEIPAIILREIRKKILGLIPETDVDPT